MEQRRGQPGVCGLCVHVLDRFSSITLDVCVCQERLCNTAAATYYLQFGTDGLNDAPECSGRGVCDYTSGICKCFKVRTPSVWLSLVLFLCVDASCACRATLVWTARPPLLWRVAHPQPLAARSRERKPCVRVRACVLHVRNLLPPCLSPSPAHAVVVWVV